MEQYWALFWATGLPQAWMLTRRRTPEEYQGVRRAHKLEAAWQPSQGRRI